MINLHKKKLFYVYSQQMGNRIQYGLVCEVSAEQYDKDIIKKHELTLVLDVMVSTATLLSENKVN